MKEQFKQFLIDSGCFESFEKNLKDNSGRSINQFCENRTPEQIKSFIEIAFQWHETEQGNNYWNEINNKWIMYFNENKQ